MLCLQIPKFSTTVLKFYEDVQIEQIWNIHVLGMAMQIFLAMRIDAYVRYSAILSDDAEVDADIRIRMAIPNTYPLFASLFHM